MYSALVYRPPMACNDTCFKIRKSWLIYVTSWILNAYTYLPGQQSYILSQAFLFFARVVEKHEDVVIKAMQHHGVLQLELLVNIDAQ